MAAKKNVAVTPAFTGRNVSLSEISQASGIGIFHPYSQGT